MKTFILVAAGALIFSSVAMAAGHHKAAPPRTVHARHHARVYDASNFPTRSTSRKTSSFAPSAWRAPSRPSSNRHASSSTHARSASHAATARPAARIASHAREDFRQDHPCPSTGWTTGACPGFVVDHIKAVKEGGADIAANMQWRPAGTPDGR